MSTETENRAAAPVVAAPEDERPNPNEPWNKQRVPRQPETPPIDVAKLPKVYPFIKRWLEFPVALVLTIMLSPILIGVTIAAWISHGAPALFRFPRLGKNRKEFAIFKFRTMHRDTKKLIAEGKAKHADLITPFGHFLRNAHLDELPQILNVLFGHISFVGPRPVDKDVFEKSMLGENECWEDILYTRPGITCLESVFADLPEHEAKMRAILKVPPAPKRRVTVALPRRYPLDRFYIENESLWLDLVIVWFTIRTFAGRAAPHK